MCYRQAMPVETVRFTLDRALRLDADDVLPAGKLCLAFANTLDWHASTTPEETLFSYVDFVAWAVRIELCSEKNARLLNTAARAQPALAKQIFAWAIELREAIYRIFVALANGTPMPIADLALLNEALPHAYALPEVVTDPGAAESSASVALRWRGDENGLDSLLWPILRSAVRLLTEGDHSRIGQCADDRGCGYLFYDTSRNRSRRWCDMNSCGNRAKSQRHYARRRHIVTTPNPILDATDNIAEDTLPAHIFDGSGAVD
jgi:predicted RNA-binding Zn ribbon-like protein